MDPASFFLLLFLFYAVHRAVEDSKKTFRKSKTSYMRSVDSRFPSLPKPQRAARAVQHDVGYWSAHALRGFPAARRGFSAGWKEARQLKADGKPVLWRNVTPPGAEDLPAAGEGTPAAPAALAPVQAALAPGAAPKPRVCVACGNPENGPRGGGGSWGPLVLDPSPLYPGDTDMPRLVHKAHFEDPSSGYHDLPYEDAGPAEAVNPHESCNTSGCGCGCHKTSSAPESATTEGEPSMERITGTMAAANASDRYGDIGRHAGGVLPASDTTYDGVLRSMSVAKSEAEVKATEAQQASTHADTLADAMQGLKVDPGTLSAMSDHQDAHDEVMKAHQKLFETAEAVEAALKRGHAGLSEAHKDAPVQAADREFYQD